MAVTAETGKIIQWRREVKEIGTQHSVALGAILAICGCMSIRHTAIVILAMSKSAQRMPSILLETQKPIFRWVVLSEDPHYQVQFSQIS